MSCQAQSVLTRGYGLVTQPFLLHCHRPNVFKMRSGGVILFILKQLQKVEPLLAISLTLKDYGETVVPREQFYQILVLLVGGLTDVETRLQLDHPLRGVAIFERRLFLVIFQPCWSR